MFPAARVTDQIVSTATQGAPVPIIPPGAPTVLIGGMPAAALGDSCGADAIVKGSATVLIGGKPAARVADPTAGGGIVMPPGRTDRADRRLTWPTRPRRLATVRFLGRGWSFPPTFDRDAGGVQMLEQEADVASSLHILLSTARGRADHGAAVRLQHGRARVREPRHAHAHADGRQDRFGHPLPRAAHRPRARGGRRRPSHALEGAC